MERFISWGLWPLLPYAFGLAAFLYGRNSAAAAEMRRISSKQNAVAFGILALFSSYILILVENLSKHLPPMD